MRIVVPESFRHAADLSAQDASRDPRLPLPDAELEIDMRACGFIRPPAALWCAVYALLAKAQGASCRLLVPENFGVCVYLKSLGLFDVLKTAGVEIDDRGVPERKDTQIVLPLSRFNTEYEVDKLSNQVLDVLSSSPLGSPHLNAFVSDVFAELANNAVQHSESSVGALGAIQFYQGEYGRRFMCVVADGGIGIRRSLEKNPALRSKVPYDWVAIDLALRERVSGTGLPTRGIGLSWINDEMRKGSRYLIIHSGQGMLSIYENAESEARRVMLFPGTLASASMPG